MSEFLIILQPTRPGMLVEGATEREAAIVARHANYLKEHAARGNVLLYGRTQEAGEATIGLVLLEVDSEAEARAIMVGDPAVAGGVMHAELYPYHAVHFAGRKSQNY